MLSIKENPKLIFFFHMSFKNHNSLLMVFGKDHFNEMKWSTIFLG